MQVALVLQAEVDTKLRRSLEAKLSELRNSFSKHNQEETERKYAIRYHKVRGVNFINIDAGCEKATQARACSSYLAVCHA